MTKAEKSKIDKFIKRTVKKSVWIYAPHIKIRKLKHVKVVDLSDFIFEWNKLVKGLKNEEKQRKTLSKR